MKKIILASAILGIFSVSASASKGDEAPAAVKASFTKLYPNVAKVKWEKEGANYEAEFDLNKQETSCLFDAGGNLLETETEIAISDLPKSVSDYVAKNYSGQKISEASKIVDSKKITVYEAEIKEGDLIFDDKGIFIKKIVAPKGEKEDDDEKDEKK